MASNSSLSEESKLAINHLISFELNVSDAYSSLAFYYAADKMLPFFIPFFEDQVVVKKEHARQFLQFLKCHKAEVSLPVIQRPDITKWGTGSEAIQTIMDLEKVLESLLKDLQDLAQKNGEADLTKFLKIFFIKQLKNLRHLNYQLSYQKTVEKLALENEDQAPLPKKDSSEKPPKLYKRKIQHQK